MEWGCQCWDGEVGGKMALLRGGFVGKFGYVETCGFTYLGDGGFGLWAGSGSGLFLG